RVGRHRALGRAGVHRQLAGPARAVRPQALTRPARAPYWSIVMEELLIVTTGGTIDKTYFDDKSDFQVGDPQIGRMLSELDVAFRFRVIPILRKDSLHLVDDDRELLRSTIASQPTRRVQVADSHDTRVEEARVQSTLADRTIALTGALRPARFSG